MTRETSAVVSSVLTEEDIIVTKKRKERNDSNATKSPSVWWGSADQSRWQLDSDRAA